MSSAFLYPEIEPYTSGYIQVSDIHSLYYEESGNRDGKPVLFLHGGPGSGSTPTYRRFFDPGHYRIILFDQRGSGKSQPLAELQHNTTWHLIEDIETLRTHLSISQWQIFGGSWGSALALAYAGRYAERITELVLRGIFLLRPTELEWFYQKGANYVFPDLWDDFVSILSPSKRNNIISSFYELLVGSDRSARIEAARAWTEWEVKTSYLRENPTALQRAHSDDFCLSFARIETHYFVNHGFFPKPYWFEEVIPRIRAVPAVIVQGRYDMVCPMKSAWEVHKAWPEARFTIVADAGHSALDPSISQALVDATDRFRGPDHHV